MNLEDVFGWVSEGSEIAGKVTLPALNAGDEVLERKQCWCISPRWKKPEEGGRRWKNGPLGPCLGIQIKLGFSPGEEFSPCYLRKAESLICIAASKVP